MKENKTMEQIAADAERKAVVAREHHIFESLPLEEAVRYANKRGYLIETEFYFRPPMGTREGGGAYYRNDPYNPLNGLDKGDAIIEFKDAAGSLSSRWINMNAINKEQYNFLNEALQYCRPIVTEMNEIEQFIREQNKKLERKKTRIATVMNIVRGKLGQKQLDNKFERINIDEIKDRLDSLEEQLTELLHRHAKLLAHAVLVENDPAKIATAQNNLRSDVDVIDRNLKELKTRASVTQVAPLPPYHDPSGGPYRGGGNKQY